MANEIFLYDEIGPAAWGLIDANVFIDALKSFGSDDVVVRINSPGGDVFEALAIVNAMKRHPGQVDVAIDSLAASAASVIAMGGRSISIARNAYLMIHNPYTTATGTAADFEGIAVALRKVTETIIDTYKDQAGQKVSRSKLKELLDSDSYLSAEESLGLGLVDEIVDGLAIAANIGREKLLDREKMPAELLKGATAAAIAIGSTPGQDREKHVREGLTAVRRSIAKREIDLLSRRYFPESTAREA